MTEKKKFEKRYAETARQYMTDISKAIITLDNSRLLFHYYCEKLGWDDNIDDTGIEAVEKLGVALAELVRLEEEDSKGEE